MTAGPRNRLRLGRRSRVTQGRDFMRAKVDGRRMAWGCMVANWLPTPPGSQARLGVITSRRIGNAIARNRARRLLREAFRQHQRELAFSFDLILIARNSIAGKPFSEVESDFLAGLRRARLWKPAAAKTAVG